MNTTILGTIYFTEAQGDTSCKFASRIRTVQECRIACNKLGTIATRLKPGKECYVAANGRCRQDGKRGPKGSLVCTKEGKKLINLYQNGKREMRRETG